MTDLTADPDAPDAVFFDAVLRPHRSLPHRGFFIVMLLVAGVSFVISLGFVLLGAWPVTGFFGLDVLLLYWAFRINYRNAREHEVLRLTGDALTVDKVSIRGEHRQWRLQPFWLRVVLEEKDEDENRLYVTSHGRSVPLGTFLAPQERRTLAQALKDALGRWRADLQPRQAES